MFSVLGRRKRTEDSDTGSTVKSETPDAKTMPSTVTLGKRKRKQVCYAEPDVDDLDRGPGPDGLSGDEHDMPDDDAVYTAGKKLRKTKKRAKATTKPKKEQKPFPLLSLPAELRDQIYELALSETSGVMLLSTSKASRRIAYRGEFVNGEDRYTSGVHTHGIDTLPIRTKSLTPALLAANKQIHAEASAWLYQQPLYFADTMVLHTFLAGIGPSNRQLLTHLVTEGYGGGRGTHKFANVAALTSLADCTNVKTLRFDCDIGYRRDVKGIARQLFRDGHFWLERMGVVHGKRDAGVEVVELSGAAINAYGCYDGDEQGLEEGMKEARKELRRLLKV